MLLKPCLLSIAFVTVAAQSQQCKPLPGDPGWPRESQWQQLNSSVSGRLLAVVPPGAVCHPGQPTFNNASCAVVRQQWPNASFHESNPWTSLYNDDTCLPDSSAPCSAEGYPAYSVAAESASDVQAAVTFARNTGVRLAIKGTGHDFPGRSAGAGSLSIWTHHLRGIEIDLNDTYAHQQGAAGSAKLGAGMTWGEIYAVMAEQNLTAVGGADPHVGVGGWTQGGGHGPVTSVYGLGADQVLSMEVVTADGDYRVINATSDSDLFWAMRGGGPSTYAVMLSLTVKIYPQSSAAYWMFQYNTTTNSDTYWSLAAYFQAQLPKLSNAGANGYIYFFSYGASSSAADDNVGSMSGVLIFLNKTSDEVAALMKPIEESFNTSSWAADPITVGSYSAEFPSFMSAWLNNPPETGGVDGRLASRLLDDTALTANVSELKLAEQSAHLPSTFYIAHLVSGPGVHNAKPAGGSNAVLPAWRKSYVHFLMAADWPYLNETIKEAVTAAIRRVFNPTLAALAPDTGAYMNEADPSNPNWKQDYFGENYDQLLSIKQKWDPTSVFWCKPCVGHDLWNITNGPNDEEQYDWGIGQGLFRLCREQATSKATKARRYISQESEL